MRDYSIGDLVKINKNHDILPTKNGSIGLISAVKETSTGEKAYFVFFREKETFLMYREELELVS